MAICYEAGQGVKRNKKQAFFNYLSAALLGDKQSIYEVGRCYFYGIGVPKDIIMSKRWLYAARHWNIK
ncbi:sel1 repeat family protein [Nostoc ellipsosporum NOK]|nr:sel1 repeat family protein [Nostoc ellipsosporum NOK]